LGAEGRLFESDRPDHQRQHRSGAGSGDVAVISGGEKVPSGEAVAANGSLPAARSSLVNRFLTGVCLVTGAVCITLLCMEVMLRLVGYNPFRDLLDGRQFILRVSSNPDLIYELTPNSRGFAWGTDVEINSFGFRDREYATDKPESVTRIVAIGDSVTFGNYLPLEATFPKQLERRLRRRGVQAEVLNFGVGGYDILQEVALLRSKGLQFEPDAVIVGYCMNDVGVGSPNLDYIRRAAQYGSPAYRSRLLQFVRSRLDILEAKLDAFARTREERPQQGRTGDPYIDERIRIIAQRIAAGARYHHDLSWYPFQKNLDKLELGFRALRELSLQHGFALSVVIIPFLHEPDAAYEAAYELVEYEATRNGLTVVDVLDRFQQVGIEELRIRASDGVHPNEQGHQILAEELLEINFSR
jgi:lysophospholipase L1-like esterase